MRPILLAESLKKSSSVLQNDLRSIGLHLKDIKTINASWSKLFFGYFLLESRRQ